jgi:hypothetical protein
MTGLKRVRYVDGQLLSAEDLRAEQDYHRERARRHNRLAHGAGVVHGLEVTVVPGANGPGVRVSPGFAIDPDGNEVDLCEAAGLLLPATATRVAVSVRYVEHLADHVPGADGLLATRVEEGAEVVLTPLAKGQHSIPPAAGLLLAILRSTKRGWRPVRPKG